MRILRALILAGIASVHVSAAHAAQVAELSLSVQDPRPMERAVDRIVKRHQLQVTYEDPPYIYSGDIRDVTTEVRRDLANYPPGQAPKVFAPKGGSIKLRYSVLSATSKPEQPVALLRNIVRAHEVSAAGATFDVRESDGVIHVIPVSFRDATGRLVPLSPVLDTVISLPAANRSTIEALEALCAAVTESAKVQVGMFTAPINLLSRNQFSEAVYNETARDVLTRILKSTQRKLVWQLIYDVNTKLYGLNIQALPESTANSASARPSSTSSPSSPIRPRQR